jgi:hypothetical protein
MPLLRDLAMEACNEIFKDSIKKITVVLEQSLATAKDEAAKKECVENYKRGLVLCNEVFKVSIKTVDKVFPPLKADVRHSGSPGEQ